MSDPTEPKTNLRPEPQIGKSHYVSKSKPAKPKQKCRAGDKVSMSVTEGGVKYRKDFTVDKIEHSEVDNKWIYSLKTEDGIWKGGQFFRETDLILTG